ncbi:MAG: glutathione S-transferase [Candidatus Neomarinimicrobiota bacterium]|nr:glutathione S-transferase [Candidatus Neomarinimicrobiota bacterium]
MRARMALAYSEITVDLREISLKNRPKSLYEVSKKGTVPVLCINDNKVIDESLDIMLWSLKNKDSNGWINNNLDSQLEIIENNDTQFKHWLDKYKYFDRYPEKNRDYYRNRCNDFLVQINDMLMKNKFLMSDSLALVDIAIFPFIRQFSNVDQKWLYVNYENIFIWLEGLLKSELFISVMNKYSENNGESLIVNFNCE